MLGHGTDTTKERFMYPYRSSSYLQTLLIGALFSCAATAASTETHFAPVYGGYLVSADFNIDAKNHAVISPPTAMLPGDLLRIRPLRLNNDEYLILQKCNLPDCTQSQVVRAWNALGHMGPDLLISNKVPIEAGFTYMLWMQRIPTRGGNSFSLYERNSPPLVFRPAGSPQIFSASDLEGARKRGPMRIDRSSTVGTAFIAKFAGGSVVRMQLLRPKTGAATVALR
jgi:hypothetical protein